MKQSDYNILTQDDEGKTILFNSMTGSVFRLDDRVSEIIQMDQIEKFEKKEIDLLKKHGMIVDKNNSQLSNYDYYHNLQKYSNDMLGITWLTTWGCNLSCTYCFEGDNKDSNIVSSHEEIDRLLKFIEQNYHRTRFKYLAVTLFGGEPMMNYKGIKLALPKMKEFCVKNDVIFIVNMVSNGLLLTENNVKFLTENGLETIQITVDGSRELHNTKRIYENRKGTYDRIMEKLEFLKDTYPELNTVIRINIDRENFEDIDNLFKDLENRGLNKLTIDFGIIRDEAVSCGNISNICYLDEELGDILYKLWLKAVKRGFIVKTVPSRRFMYCGLNKENSYTFAPNMDFYKCWEQLGDETHKFGYIDKQGNIQIKNELYFDWMNKNPTVIGECKTCKYLGNCGGGCSVNSFNRYGTYKAPGCYQVKGVIEKQLVFSLANNQIKKNKGD